MKLSETADWLLLSSGQYVLGSVEETGLNLDKLWRLLKPEFKNFQRYVPLEKHFNINSSGQLFYDFKYDVQNVGSNPSAPQTNLFEHTLNVASSQTFELDLSGIPIVQQSVQLSIGGTLAATDDGFGNLTFQNGFESLYTGEINYTSGVITLTAGNVASENVIEISVVSNYVVYGVPPRFIQSVVPINTIQLLSLIATWITPYLRGDRLSSPDRLIEPRLFTYRYDWPDPMARLTEAGIFDVIAQYDWWVKETRDASGRLIEVDIPCIEDHNNFYVLERLFSAKFREAIGLSRRAFTDTNLDIAIDGPVLVSEARSDHSEALDLLYSRHSWADCIKP